MLHNAFLAQQNQYHLGLWYASYRFIISFCLLLVFALSVQHFTQTMAHQHVYLSLIIIYFVFNSIQLVLFRHVRLWYDQQLLALFVVDIIVFSGLSFVSNGPSLNISLLFAITIFAASLLLEKNNAVIVTLVSVICVIYQHFIGSFFDFSALNNVGNSALLAFLFFVVYGLGQLAIRRFQILENLNIKQAIELKRLQNINRCILEQIETGYLVLDENHHILLSTPAAHQLLGIENIQAHHKKPLYLIQPDLFDILKFDQLKHREKFQFQSQTTPHACLIEVQKLIVPQSTLTLLVIEDAVKINQRVQQLKLAALGQLSASIAHEIRNPLAAIVQANELLNGSTPDQQQMLSSMIHKQSQRIDKIIQDTLNMVRNKETQPVEICLTHFVQHMLLEDLTDISDQIHVNIQEPLKISFDESQLRQILINLLRNAVRHNQGADQNVELKAYIHHKSIYIDIIDFGEGVAEKDLVYLFKPFFSTEINGTGLGLYLSHSFCEANQAKLDYVKQQQGACFRLECPRVI